MVGVTVLMLWVIKCLTPFWCLTTDSFYIFPILLYPTPLPHFLWTPSKESPVAPPVGAGEEVQTMQSPASKFKLQKSGCWLYILATIKSKSNHTFLCTSHFYICLSIFSDHLKKIHYVRNTSLHKHHQFHYLNHFWVEACPVSVSDHNIVMLYFCFTRMEVCYFSAFCWFPLVSK